MTDNGIEIIDVSKLKDVLVWRAIVSRRHYGHWEYLFEDYVLCNHIGTYILDAQAQNAERISLYLMGRYEDVRDMTIKPMKGVSSLAQQRKVARIEDFDGR